MEVGLRGSSINYFRLTFTAKAVAGIGRATAVAGALAVSLQVPTFDLATTLPFLTVQTFDDFDFQTIVAPWLVRRGSFADFFTFNFFTTEPLTACAKSPGGWGFRLKRR